MHPKPSTAQRGFTLIEMSIVLVIIGLIVGGVLVGRDLIKAAEVRATISQIEKFNTAANTFYGKYGYLPGDIPDPYATQFGLIARGSVTHHEGRGDGSGLIEGDYEGRTNNNCGLIQLPGEPVVFWVDLSTVGLIEGGFNAASNNAYPPDAVTPASTPPLNAYLPAAKLGGGNSIYVWSNGSNCGAGGVAYSNNYFGLASVTAIGDGGVQAGKIFSNPGLTVNQAYRIDMKIDDGQPQSGNAIAVLLDSTNYSHWAGTTNTGGPYTTATPGSTTTCYDNGGVAGAKQKYSLTQNSGNGVNCALSFRFQ